MPTRRFTYYSWLMVLSLLLLACGNTPPTQEETLKVGVVLGTGVPDDKGYNEYTLKGAREVAQALSLELDSISPHSSDAYEEHIERLIAEGADLIITNGFQPGEAVGRAARRHPEVKFAILDYAYLPGIGCPESMSDCYIGEGGLSNVTSLMFAEDEVAYLAGVLAGCMSESGTVASVAGMEVAPLIRFVTGFQNGARSMNPEIVTLNEYIPDFDDPATGKVVAQSFINEGADVLFAVAGNTGNGALAAAQEAGVMAIGVDVDQYHSYPEVRSILLTSAMKNVDVAAAAAVRDFAAGTLTGGIRTLTVANGGVGLAPYHEWEDKIPAECKAAVEAAKTAIKDDPSITGAKP